MSGCSSCPSQGSCSSQSSGNCPSNGAFVPQFWPLGPQSRIGTVIAVGSGKGGVGKSTVSALLAVALRREGYQVGILDADITGPSMAQAFGLESGLTVTEEDRWIPPHTRSGMPLISLNLLLENKEDPVVWRGPVLGSVIKQFWSDVNWGNLDVLILDMPPGTGDVPLTVFQSIPVDRFLVVTSPQDLVRMIVTKACRMAEKMGVPVLGLVENYSYLTCAHCGERMYPFGAGKTQEAAELLGLPFLDALPIDSQVQQAMDEGRLDASSHPYLQQTVEAISELIEKKRAFAASSDSDE